MWWRNNSLTAGGRVFRSLLFSSPYVTANHSANGTFSWLQFTHKPPHPPSFLDVSSSRGNIGQHSGSWQVQVPAFMILEQYLKKAYIPIDKICLYYHLKKLRSLFSLKKVWNELDHYFYWEGSMRAGTSSGFLKRAGIFELRERIQTMPMMPMMPMTKPRTNPSSMPRQSPSSPRPAAVLLE